MIQTAELVTLVVINTGTVLQFHLVQRAATRYCKECNHHENYDRNKHFSNVSSPLIINMDNELDNFY